jgi:GNAT superfamily N-acetyltransferase
VRLHRLRIELDDTPGALGRIATGLGAVGVNVVDLDVQCGGADARVDEVVVERADGTDLRTLEAVVSRAGGRLVGCTDLDPHELRDRLTASLHLVASMIGDGGADASSLAEAARILAGGELGYVHRCVPGGSLDVDEVVARVRQTRCPAQVERPVKLLPAGSRPTWWLLLPTGTEPPDVLVLVRRGARFTFTETARVQALCTLDALVRRRPPRVLARLRDGGTVELRTVGRDDIDALSRLHRRCSDATLRKRYLGAVPKDAHRFVARLVDPATGNVAIGAVAQGEVLGVAHACPDGHGGFEMAFLVEDAHQSRGIGTLLLAELRARLTAAGASADNAPMRRMMRSAGAAAPAWAHGVLRYEVPVATGSSTNSGITRSVAAW